MYPISKRRASLLLSQFPNIANSKVLNVGSGIGCLSDILADDHRCHVIDLDKSEWIKSQRPNTIHRDILDPTTVQSLLCHYKNFDYAVTENVLSGMNNQSLTTLNSNLLQIAQQVHIVQTRAQEPFTSRSIEEYQYLLPNAQFVVL